MIIWKCLLRCSDKETMIFGVALEMHVLGPQLYVMFILPFWTSMVFLIIKAQRSYVTSVLKREHCVYSRRPYATELNSHFHLISFSFRTECPQSS